MKEEYYIKDLINGDKDLKLMSMVKWRKLQIWKKL